MRQNVSLAAVLNLCLMMLYTVSQINP